MSRRGSRGFQVWLLDSLSDREVAGLVELLSKRKRRHGNNKSFIRSFDNATLLGILSQEVFGEWDSSITAFSVIKENVEKVKKLLRETPVNTRAVGSVLPPIPYNLRITNETVGSIFVTNHAWVRFCERFCTSAEKQKPAQIAERLQRYFANARKISLEGARETLRTIRNQFKTADYYLNQSASCRFVVALENGRIVLLTVERPFS